MPIYITENGIADRDDRLRELFFHWSLLDNFEWIKGFGPRFGLYKVDYETLERTLNPSARVFQELIKQEPIRTPRRD